MPRYTVATKETVDGVLEVTARAFPTAKNQFTFWQAIEAHVIPNEDGMVSFRPIMVAFRRRAVMELFDGGNAKEVARILNISVKAVHDDIAAYYTTQEYPASK